MSAYVTALVGGAIGTGVMFELLRRRQVKEKYAVLWLGVGMAMLILAIFPGLLDLVANWIGVKSGPNLLFLVTGLVLLLVCVHLSWEVSRLEDRSRGLAEELGLLRLELDEQRDGSSEAGRAAQAGD